MHRTLAIFAAAVLAIAAPQAAYAQRPIKVINDPASLDWEYYGTGYKLKPIRDPAIPAGAAVEVKVDKGRDPYSAGANIHLTERLHAGRNYVVRFWARTLSAKSDDGKGRILVRFFQNSEPYPGFGDTLVEVGPDWRYYEVSGKATIDVDAAQAAVGMQLGSVEQTLQLGQAVVAEGATSFEGQNQKLAAPDPIPPQIAGKGELLNDPMNRNWIPYGKLQTSVPTTTDVYTRKGVLMTVAAAGENS